MTNSRRRKYIPMTLVLISWDDSYGVNATWADREEIAKDFKPCDIKSVGWVIRDEPKRFITVAPHCSDEEDITGALCIPHCCITNIQVLQEAES